jgi:hypothetical protein
MVGVEASERRVYVGIDGVDYVSRAAAASELGVPTSKLASLVSLTSASGLIDPKHRGRPPKQVVARHEIARVRLERASVAEETAALKEQLFDQLQAARRRIRELESSYAELLDDYERLRVGAENHSTELMEFRRRNALARRLVPGGGA